MYRVLHFISVESKSFKYGFTYFFSNRFFLLNQDPIHGIISSLHTIHQFNFGFEIHVVLTWCCSKTCGLEIEKKMKTLKKNMRYNTILKYFTGLDLISTFVSETPCDDVVTQVSVSHFLRCFFSS